jgi:hypothetical protein
MATDSTTAGHRLRLLRDEYLQHPAREPGNRTATGGPPPAPMNLGMLDHITDSITEVVTHVRTDAPHAGPAPANPAGIYDWWIQSTPNLEDERRLERDRVIYRQGLEHAIRAGDTDIVRKHPCPGCECWGLVWSQDLRRAACLNQDCVDGDGVGTTWKLGHLAYEHIARVEKMLESRAT